MPEPVLSASGFGYTYPTAAAPVLCDVSLHLEAGSFTVLAGRSGSGKSTLLRAACGLVPHFHGGEASGSMSVGGLSLRDHGPAEIASVCGTIFQDPESQVVMNGVRAEIGLPLENRGDSAGAVARGVEEAALSLGVAHLLERRTDSLSGGELQRVALAAAIATRPRLLVLDEPTSQLDPVAGDELVWVLRRLNEEWGTAVLIAEHRLERCLPAADRVITLEGGAIAFDGAPEGFLGWAVEQRPELATPLARLFELANLGRPYPVSVKEARASVDCLLPTAYRLPSPPSQTALNLRSVWLEIPNGPAILRGLDFKLQASERVALMGRNGAGKSTLLRIAKGLIEPTRGKVKRAGEAALLLQNPGDYLLHEHAGEEADTAGLLRAGLEGRGEANPKDLSGGERQRLALEVVLGGEAPGAVLLDEPTRGMDRAHKAKLATRLTALASAGAGVLVATHDTEWAATWADRVVLLGTGEAIADGPATEVLTGGWHFTTDTARVTGAALTPEAGAALLGERREELVR